MSHPIALDASHSRCCPACGYAIANDRCARCPGSVRMEPDGPWSTPRTNFFLFDLVDGFLEVFRGGVRVFTRPEFAGKLRGALVANVIAIPTVVALLWLGFHGLFVWARMHEWGPFGWLRHLPNWLEAIATTVLALLGVLMLLPVIVENVVGPFLEPLADQNEKLLGGPAMHAQPQPWLRSLRLAAAFSARVLVIQIAVFAISLALSFCGLGLGLAFLASAWLAALVWFEIPFARRGYSRATRGRLLRANWARAFGFGLGFQVGLFVPIFNLLLLTPAAAIAVTTLFLRFEKSGLARQQPALDAGRSA